MMCLRNMCKIKRSERVKTLRERCKCELSFVIRCVCNVFTRIIVQWLCLCMTSMNNCASKYNKGIK